MSFYSNRGRYQRSRSVHWAWVVFLLVSVLLCAVAGIMAVKMWIESHKGDELPSSPTGNYEEESPVTIPSGSEPSVTVPSQPAEFVLPDTLELLAPAVATNVSLQPEELVSGLEGTGITVTFAQPLELIPGVVNVELLFSANGQSCKRQTAVYCFTLNESFTVDMAEGHVPAVGDFLEDDSLQASFAQTDVALNRPGQTVLTLVCDGREYSVTYNVTESVAPVGIPKPVTAQAGTLPNPAELLESIIDDSQVAVTWQTVPELKVVGPMSVTLVLTDSFGNSSSVESMINVIANENAPQFIGLDEIKIQVGDVISYKNGVTVTDAQDGEIGSFSIDANGMDRNTVGTYTVYYQATDSDGNTTIAPRTIVIQEIGQAVVEEKAWEVINAIITDDMSRDEKIYAVWYYTRVTVQYVGSSDKSSIIAGAYEGFTTAQGDCYTYYAMNVVLLDLLGIESVEVRRYGGVSNHWWNLIQFEDGLWYHVDSCPSRIQMLEVNQSKMTENDLLVYSANPDVLERRPNYYIYDHSLPQYEGLDMAP